MNRSITGNDLGSRSPFGDIPTALVGTKVTPEEARAAGRQTLREIGVVDNDTPENRAVAREMLEALGLVGYAAVVVDRKGVAQRAKNPRRKVQREGLLEGD